MRISKLCIIGFIIPFVYQSVIVGQIMVSGIPESFNNKIIKVDSVLQLPSIDSSYVIANELVSKKNMLKRYEVAKNFATNISPSNSGSWQEINGKRIWTLKIKSKGALAIAVIMKSISLMKGEKLFIYNNSGVLGAFTSSNVQKIMTFQPLQGDEVIIEYSTYLKKGSEGNFVIETVAHFLKNITYNDPQSGSCNIDINCPLGINWQTEKQAVCVYFTGIYECTGTLINNTANDSKPYIIAANHCFINGQYDADRSIFFFNFESQACNGAGDKQNLGTDKQVLYGAKIVASSYDHDFILLHLNQQPPMEVKPYYAGWDLNSTSDFDTLACIHHPQWSVKKISMAYHSPTTGTYTDSELNGASNAFWKMPVWGAGVTEGGSSGSSLFNKNHRIIGTLTGGASACDSLTGIDYYEKFSESYKLYPDSSQQLKYWLDPNNSGVSYLDGYAPFKETFTMCDTLTNLEQGEKTSILPYEFGKGYYSGNNSDSITDFAEKFSNTDSAYLTGVNLHVGQIGNTGGLIVTVYKNKLDTSGVLYETYIPYSNMKANTMNYIEIYPYLKLNTDFYIGYKIPYQGTDTFTLYSAFARYNDNLNSAYVKFQNNWVPLSTITSTHWGSAFDIKPNLCFINKVGLPNLVQNTNFTVFPNPAHNSIKLNLPDNSNNLKYELFDLYGRTLLVGSTFPSNEINVAGLLNGIYFIKVSSGNRTYSAKFVKTE